MKRFLILILLTLAFSTTSFSLSSEIKFDLLKMKLVEAMKDKDYNTAVNTAVKIKAMKKKLPISFEYHEGKANYELGNYKKANTLIESYLTNVGNKGKFYSKSLKILIAIEKKHEEQQRVKKAKDEKKKKAINKQRRLQEEQQRAKKAKDEKKRKAKKIFDSPVKTIGNLMWQDEKYTVQNRRQLFWSGAKQYCSDLKLNNYTDWRLPSKKELFSIFDKNRNDFTSKFKYFKQDKGRCTWTSTPGRPYNDKKTFWCIGSENTGEHSTYNTRYVRCVR